ncbi:MAG: tetratricopeptide repeat protein, partial [Pseudomonadota bacterium]
KDVNGKVRPTEALFRDVADGLSQVEDAGARFALAEGLIAAGRNEDGVDHLLTILQTKMDWSEGKAKEKLLQVFEAAGPTDPVTVDGRRRLASLMFA